MAHLDTGPAGIPTGSGSWAIISDRSRPLDLIDYSVTEDATPLAPGDSSGGVGQISLTARAIISGALRNRTASLVDHTVQLFDMNDIDDTPFRGRGSVFGKITSVSQPGERATMQADSLLTRLNADRDAKPFFGVADVGQATIIRQNLMPNPSSETDVVGYDHPGSGAATVSRVTGTAPTVWSGGAKARCKWTSAGATSGSGMRLSGITVAEAVTYTGSFYARVWLTSNPTAGVDAQRLQIKIEWKNNVGGDVGSTLGEVSALPVDTWTRLVATGEAPVGAVTANVFVYNTAGTSYVNWAIGDELELDGGLFEQSSGVAEFFDGNSASSAWDGTTNNSTSTQTLVSTAAISYDATVGNAFRYYCGLVGIEESSVQVSAIYETQPVAYPAWSGNVWEHVKKLCTATGGEVAMVDNLIHFRKPRRHIVPVEIFEQFTQSVSVQNVAQNVELYNYNNVWAGDKVAHAAETVYSVDSASSIEVVIPTDASLTTVNDPIAVASITPSDYTSGSGQYTILDADNVSVDPDWWNENGGKVTAELTADDYHNITVTITGAREDDNNRGPFRLSEWVIDQAQPALYITGGGVFTEKEIVRIPTGAAVELTSVESAATIDNPFISNISQAYDRGVLAAQQAAGPIVTISGSIGYDSTADGQEFGVVVGSRIKVYDGIYRVTTANYRRGDVGIEAVLDMTFDDMVDLFSLTYDEFNGTYSGYNFDAFNALWDPALDFDTFNGSTAAPTLDTFNTLFDGLNFDAYAVFPYVKEVIEDDDEARF